MRRAATVACVVGVVLLVATTGRASEPEAIGLSARLVPGTVTTRPQSVRVGARGSFSGRISPYGHGLWSAHFALATRRLSSPATTAHIHTGRPGRTGPILITLCTHGRCNLSGGSFHLYYDDMAESMRLLGAYVDVHTQKNPRGELRGQIVFED
jgi:CHRD domain